MIHRRPAAAKEGREGGGICRQCISQWWARIRDSQSVAWKEREKQEHVQADEREEKGGGLAHAKSGGRFGQNAATVTCTSALQREGRRKKKQ